MKIRMKKYLKIISVAVQTSMEYRVNLLLTLMSCFFPILIQIYMWITLYSNSGEDTIFNYSYPQMLFYAVTATVLSKMIAADYCSNVSNDIKNGSLSGFLVRPFSYFTYTVSQFVGNKVIGFSVLMIITIALLAVFNAIFDMTFSLLRIALFIAAIFVAMILKFLISFVISCSSFWMTESGGILLAVNVISLVISGAYFPLDIFGNVAITVSRMLPFYYTIYFPVNIINGRTDISEIAVGFAVQLVWIGLLYLIKTLIWNRGIKLYTAVGG